MGKYSFFCKNCGESFSSDDKEEVKQAKFNHKTFNPQVNSLVCRMVKTKNKTIARPSLAIIIDNGGN